MAEPVDGHLLRRRPGCVIVVDHIDDNDADVVAPAPSQRQADQFVGRFLGVFETTQNCRNGRVGHLARQPVAAQDEPVTGRGHDLDRVDFDRGLGAQCPRHVRPLRVGSRLIGTQCSFSD